MPDERAIIAIGRIERALARIEGEAGRLNGASADDGQLQLLRERHQALRGKIEGAISQIDRMLEGRGGQ